MVSSEICRPTISHFMLIKLAGEVAQALLDPVASGCIIDYDLCKSLPGVMIDTAVPVRMETAAGPTTFAGVACIKVRWVGGYRLQPFNVLRGCRQAIILGHDFLRVAGIVPDVANGTWSSRHMPGVDVPFKAPMSFMACMLAGMHVWQERVENSACPTAYQSQLLDVLNAHANTFQKKPGVAKGVKHVINTGTSASV